ncbi:LOW QUALITY PROTEIN: hypothetical protein IFM46972_06828 [Aspergillus udagawae]|uniref:Uncharacterized protein n=1 Tax=Aspergillus udagawae TaxID=91492 RepID=A0A8H3NZ35_9EURO|nr:LOW QUALITY PROTEIN: hypothetical protein IFM46972_06828 [Aspergillus udagawae]
MAELGAVAGSPAIDEQTCSDLRNARLEDLYCSSLLEVYCEDEVATKCVNQASKFSPVFAEWIQL